MIRRKKKNATHISGDAQPTVDTTYYVRGEQTTPEPELISQTMQGAHDTHSAPANDAWTERYGNRTVELAVGLGWQVAIIYLSTPAQGASAIQGSGVTAPGLPPRDLVSKTIKSRTTSLGLANVDESQTWTVALSKLIDGNYTDETEARHLAQNLHLGLVESLSISGKYMRPAYELGRLLSEAVLLAAGANVQEKPRVYRQLFDPLRLLPLAEWLATLESLLPAGAAQAVFGSLQNWSRWIAQAKDEDFDSADDFLREQARIWRDLLLGRLRSQDLTDTESNALSDSYRDRPLTESLADISLAAAFNNRASSPATTPHAEIQSDGLRATRLPKHTTPIIDTPDIDDTVIANHSAELTANIYSEEEQSEKKVSPTPIASQPQEHPETTSDFPKENAIPPLPLSISRFSLGVNNENTAADVSTPENDSNTAKTYEGFKNDTSVLANSLDDKSENSWMTKLPHSTEDLFFDHGNLDSTDTKNFTFPMEQYSPDPEQTASQVKKNHPGFDIDIYENFDFDFAPGFAPGFMPPNPEDKIKEIIRKDGAAEETASTTSKSSIDPIGDWEKGPDLLPFDLNTLQNFNINNVKPTFTHEDVVSAVYETQNTSLPNAYSNFEQAPGVPALTQSRQTPSVSRRRIKFLSLVFILFSLLFAARAFVVTPVEVRHGSLPPVIKNGQWVLISKLAISYRQGDIVYITKPGTNISLFARIIALPGEAITSSDNTVYVNGTAISNKKWYREMVGSCVQKSAASIPQEVVPSSQYAIMSSCSQLTAQNNIPNPVPSQDISGKVIAVVWENSHPWFDWL